MKNKGVPPTSILASFHKEGHVYCIKPKVFKKYSILFFLLIVGSISGYSQDVLYQLQRDTVEVEDQELETEPEETMSAVEREQYYTHYPRLASLYSAVLPGLGQAYNKKYWKIPIIYIGSGVLIYYINFNNRRYVELKSALFTHLNNEGTEGWVEGLVVVPGRPNLVPEANVRRQIDNDRRNRDYLIIITGIVYMLNIVDAMVDAHLKGFDLGDDLSFQIKPTGGQADNTVRYAGLSFTLKF